MKAIMLMFDSLNRHFLPPYGNTWVHAPNFRRLAERTVTFTHSYVGSMPCMPARRELHTGRYNFLHRSWGPLEPFDDSMPALLRAAGVYTHLVSDHYHYWEDGGATYHNRYNSWDAIRGQEGDPWIGQVAEPDMPEAVGAEQRVGGPMWRQDWVNRDWMDVAENRHPLARTVAGGLEFIDRNRAADNWFLHIECFDPHEPFYVPQKYRDLYPHDYDGPHFDWPPYRRVQESHEAVRHVRLTYAALLSMCDAYLGKVLDTMDELDLWKDTMLIVNTDHGHMLGEKNWWAKSWQPWYNELANNPLFVWDPREGAAGERRASLVQNIDWAPTLLEFFGQPLPPDMLGQPLRPVIRDDTPVRQAGLFGLFGHQVNVTDGRYVYMRGPADPDRNQPIYEHTLMPTHMRSMFRVEELQDIQLAEPFRFTKGCRTMKIRCGRRGGPQNLMTQLFDLEADPQQERPIRDAQIEQRMIDHLIALMKENDAPPSEYERLGLEA